MDEILQARRRADSATVAGEQLLLFGGSGEIARIALVVDQLDDSGLRTPLVEDVLTAFPHGELHVAVDMRAVPGTPVAGRRPRLWQDPEPERRGWFARPKPAANRHRNLGTYDIVLRIGDRRTRSFTARPDALDLTYILAMEEPTDRQGSSTDGRLLGPSLHDRCVLQSADVVWCGSRRLMSTLRRRWQVDAGLLYPPAELSDLESERYPRRTILAAGDGISAAWYAHLETLARVRRDLDVKLHGVPTRGRNRRSLPSVEAQPERFRSLLAEASCVILPPNDCFDPRAVWAQQAGVPVIAPMASAAAETVEGLERREPTGVLLEHLATESLLDAVDFIERHPQLFIRERLTAHAQRWSRARFRKTLRSLVFDAWCAHRASTADDDEPAGSDATIDIAPLVEPLH